MSEFFFAYPGNKRTEYKEVKDLISPYFDTLETFVEPFCGSCAISYSIFKDLGDSKKYHMNDIDSNLCSFYQNIKDDNIEKMKQTLKDKYEHIQKEEYTNIIKNKEKTFDEWLLLKIFNGAGKACYPTNKTFPTLKKWNSQNPYVSFLKHTGVSNSNFKDVMEFYKNDEKTFLFIDPPYINSNNEWYDREENKEDFESLFLYIRDFMESSKCKAMLVVNDRLLMRLLFPTMIKKRYNKLYQITKRKDVHLVICNF